MTTTVLTIFISSLMAWATQPVSSVKLLHQIEKKYAASSGIEMEVTKKLIIPLLEKEKTSEGKIKIQKGGKFKWETLEPEKSTVLLTPVAVWVIDYPMDEMDKTLVLKSRRPKKNQSPAIVAFLMGQGGLTKNYKLISAEELSDNVKKIKLKARSDKEVAKEITANLNQKEMTVDQVSFVDSIGNNTTLSFKNIQFNQKFNKDEFKFSAPKDAEITIVE